MLGAVDATAVDLVDNLRLLDLLEAQVTEEVRLEGEHDGLSRLEAADALQDELDEARTDALTAVGLADGHGLELDGGSLWATNLGQNLPAGAGDEFAPAQRHGKAVDILNDVVDWAQDEFVRIALDEPMDEQHVRERGAANDNLVLHKGLL